MFANDHNEFPGKFGRKWNSEKLLPLVVRCDGSDGDKTDSHPECDQIDNKVEVVELHGRLDAPTLTAHPCARLLASIGTFLYQEPILLLKPFHPCLGL